MLQNFLLVVNINGVDARTITEENVVDAVQKYDVFGRVTPEQKKMLVKALQS